VYILETKVIPCKKTRMLSDRVLTGLIVYACINDSTRIVFVCISCMKYVKILNIVLDLKSLLIIQLLFLNFNFKVLIVIFQICLLLLFIIKLNLCVYSGPPPGFQFLYALRVMSQHSLCELVSAEGANPGTTRGSGGAS